MIHLLISLLIFLQPGDERTVTVMADSVWNRTNIQLLKGGEYELTVVDSNDWRDSYISSSTNGYNTFLHWLVFYTKRAVFEKWFALIGTIDKRKKFRIGAHRKYTCKRTGELLCYANDARLMYFNNHGWLKLKVKRLN